MAKGRAYILIVGLAGCPSNAPPPVYPDIAFPNYVAVTEGASTMFQVGLSYAPSSDVSAVLYTEDRTVAYVSPAGFNATPTNYMAIMVVYGVDDMKPGGNRFTGLNGRVQGDAATSGTKVEVVDKGTPNILSSSWGIVMAPSSTTTFEVELTQAPTMSTTVTLATGVGLVSFAPTSLSFGTTDFNVPQTVTISSGGSAGTTSISLNADSGLSPKTISVIIAE